MREFFHGGVAWRDDREQGHHRQHGSAVREAEWVLPSGSNYSSVAGCAEVAPGSHKLFNATATDSLGPPHGRRGGGRILRRG